MPTRTLPTRFFHPIYQVRAVEIVAPYTLRVQFTDNAEQVIDFRPILAGELYGPLLDLQMFNRVSIDPEVKTRMAKRSRLRSCHAS